MAPERIVWIGGGSGAGKSTMARRLAARHGLSYFSTDDAMRSHAARSTPAAHPLLHRFLAMDMDERWLNRSPETMLATFHWFAGEGFEMILDDLERLPCTPGVIIEGFRLVPHLVKPLAAPGSAVWLLPAPAFREAVFAHRALPFIAATSDPARALHNLLERDRLFTERLRAETARLDLPAIDVTTRTTEDKLEARIALVVGLSG